MVAHFVRNINSYLPGGWERTLSCGGRLVIKRQKQGQKGVISEPDGVTRRVGGYSFDKLRM